MPFVTTTSSGRSTPVPDLLDWVHSMGGPLIVVPVSVLLHWGGTSPNWGEDPDNPEDYDRACAVDGWAGVLSVGGGAAQALVLGDEPAPTCYLPKHRLFVRWHAADSEAEVLATAAALLVNPLIEWEECGVWETDGPAVLMDSVEPGSELNVEYPAGGGLPEQAPVQITSGRWRIRATHSHTEAAWVNLVQLHPA